MIQGSKGYDLLRKLACLRRSDLETRQKMSKQPFFTELPELFAQNIKHFLGSDDERLEWKVLFIAGDEVSII